MKLPVNRRLEDLPVNDFARRIAWHSRGFIKVAKWRTAGNQQVDDHGDNFSDQKLLVSILPFETNEHSVNVLECFELLRGCGCHVARSGFHYYWRWFSWVGADDLKRVPSYSSQVSGSERMILPCAYIEPIGANSDYSPSLY